MRSTCRSVGDDLVVLGLITVGLVLGLLAPRARDFATLGVALAIAAPSVIGHTRAYEPVPLLVVTDVLHLAAGSVWLGGLVGLALTLPSLAGRARDAAEVLARFSAVAAGVLGLLVVSGTLLGWRIIGSWSGLFGTTYGRLLLIKVGVVGLVAWWLCGTGPGCCRRPATRSGTPSCNGLPASYAVRCGWRRC